MHSPGQTEVEGEARERHETGFATRAAMPVAIGLRQQI
jgi:hypothetical protein